MKNNANRRTFITTAALGGFGLTLGGMPSLDGATAANEKDGAGTPAAAAAAQSPRATKFDWLRHARVFIVDGYTYPLYPKLEFDAERLAATMADMHAGVLRIATSGFDWLIPRTAFKVADHLGNCDILAESIAACKPRGIKVLPYVRTGGAIRATSMKREWARFATPGGDMEIVGDIGVRSINFCWNTPYREAFYDLIRLLVEKYDIDGVYFDAWGAYGFGTQLCYCDGCRTGFRKLFGEELPYRRNPREYTAEELERCARYRDWCKKVTVDAFDETKRIIRSRKIIPLVNNINNPGNIAGRSPDDMHVINETDAFLYERGHSIIERAEGISVASAHGMSVWPYVGTYDPFPRIPHFSCELGQEILTTLAFGGSPTLYHSYFFVDQPQSRPPITEAFRIVDDNPGFFKNTRPLDYCAVVWNNTDPPGHASEGYLWSINARLNSLGAFSACLKSHVQTTSLFQRDLDDVDILGRYKVLYLPDICSLSDNQIRNIAAFVDGGGGLVMTYATSLFNEKGQRRQDFALGDLAKIRYRKPDADLSEQMNRQSAFGSVWDMYLKARPGQNVVRPPLADGLLPAHVFETVEALPGGTIVADLVSGSGEDVMAPGVVVSQFGKGKVAYLASALGAMYLQTGIKEFADLIKNVIEYVSPERVPYKIDAPHSTLIANMTAGDDARVLHLINWTGSQSERMWQNVYHIPPVENVTVRFGIPAGRSVQRVVAFVPSDFKQRMDKDVLSITLPRVEKYQGIAVEFGRK